MDLLRILPDSRYVSLNEVLVRRLTTSNVGCQGVVRLSCIHHCTGM